MKSFAIVLVCYNRLDGVKRLLKELDSADYGGRNDICLIFSIDNSGSTEVEEYAEKYHWRHGEKLVRTFKTRQGLKTHILKCGDYTDDFDIVAVFEDDIFVSDSFYHYAYQAAEFYWDDDRIAGVSLYCFQKNWLNWLFRFEAQKTADDAYFMKLAQSWGQVWTGPKWKRFKSWLSANEEFAQSDAIPQSLNYWPESSWLKYHDRYCIETDRYFVYPYVSLTSNWSDVGEHSDICVADYQVELQYGKQSFQLPSFSEDAVIYDEYCDRVGLGKYLGVADSELCVDFWNTKGSALFKRYLLTTQRYAYKVVGAYSLSLRPIEMAVVKGISGTGIYLYDTSEPAAKPARPSANGEYNRILYSLRTHDFWPLLRFSLRLSFESCVAKIKKLPSKLFR